MKSLADGLPPEIARQIHPDWRKNEAAYWAVRDRLLTQYQGQWIGFADGAVLAAAATPLEVFLAVQQSGRHPFVIRVGHEDQPWYRIRRTSFAYDTAYTSRGSSAGGECRIPCRERVHGLASGSRHPRHRRRYNDTAMVGLPTTASRPSPRYARRHQWSRGWHGGNDWLSDLGLGGWSGVSVPASSGIRGPRTNSRP